METRKSHLFSLKCTWSYYCIAEVLTQSHFTFFSLADLQLILTLMFRLVTVNVSR